MISLKKFFENKFISKVDKINGINEAYETLAKTQYKDLIVADLMEIAGVDLPTIEIVDSNKLAFIEGKKAMALYLRNKLEQAEKGFKVLEGNNGTTNTRNTGNNNIGI